MQRIFIFLTIFLNFSFLQANFVTEFKPIFSKRSQQPIAFIQKTTQAPKIDGKLNDPCWKKATLLDPFRNTYTGIKADDQTEVYLCYDQDNIYIGILAHEPHLDRLLGRPQGKKKDVYSGDEMEIFIAPTGDLKTYYQFCVGPKHGQRYDGKTGMGKKYHAEWDSKVVLNPDQKNYVMEFKIPAKAIEQKEIADQQLWQFNMARIDLVTRPPYSLWPKGNPGTDADEVNSQWSVTNGRNNIVSKFGRLYFGSQAEFYKHQKNIQLNLVLDKEIYDEFDPYAQVALQFPGIDDREIEFKIDLLSNEKVLKSFKRIVSEFSYSHLIDLQDLQAGDYMIKASLPENGVQKSWSFKKVKRHDISKIQKGYIPLNIPSMKNNLSSWPMKTGIPFPKGVLWDKDNLRLLENGKEIPAQFSIRSKWSPNGSIRWIGCTFISNLNSKYELEYNINKNQAQSKQPIVIKKGKEHLTIETGQLKCLLHEKVYQGISKAWMDKNKNGIFEDQEVVVNATNDSSPYVTDEHGTKFQTSNALPTSFEVIEAGPIHAVIKVTGWFTHQNQGKLCQYITYYEFFAGQTQVQVDHAVIMTHDTNKLNLKDIAFPLASLGDRGHLGVDKEVLNLDRNKVSYVIQDRWDHGFLQSSNKKEGQNIRPWVDSGTQQQGVTIIAKYVAERFPKQLTLDSKHITYHLWPRDIGNTFSEEEELSRKKIYQFLYAHEGPNLKFPLPKHHIKKLGEFANKENAYFNYIKQAVDANAQGVALNESFIIQFRAQPFQPEKTDLIAKTFKKLPHAMPLPKWIETTEVFGPMASIDPEHYPTLSNFLERNFLNRAQIGIKANQEYGVWNYADMHTYWRAGGNYAGLHRTWMSHHHGQTEIPWLLYAYSGNPKFLDWARVNSHHTMNINIIHYHNEKKLIPYHKKGNIYHVKGYLHWGGDTQAAGHLAFTNYLLWKWMLTGHYRSKDIADMWIERVVEDDPQGGQGREGITFLGEVTGHYQNNWDPRLLILMDSFAKAVFGAPLQSQHATNWHPSGHIRYHNLTGSSLAFKAMNDPVMLSDHKSFHYNAYFYTRTGDEKYLNNINTYKRGKRHLFELVRSIYLNPEDKLQDGINRYSGGWINHCLLNVQLLFTQKAFKKAGRKIKLHPSLERYSEIQSGRYTRKYPGEKLEKESNQDHYILKAGQLYGLAHGMVLKLQDIEQLDLSIRPGDKWPTQATLLDNKFNELSSVNVYNNGSGAHARVNTLSFSNPNKKALYLSVSAPTTVTPQRDIKVKALKDLKESMD